MIGMPSETKETIQETLDVVEETKAISPYSSILAPMPTTKMLDVAVEKGVIKDREEYLWNVAQTGNNKLVRETMMVNLTDMSDEVLLNNYKEMHAKLKRIMKKNYPLYANKFYGYFKRIANKI